MPWSSSSASTGTSSSTDQWMRGSGAGSSRSTFRASTPTMSPRSSIGWGSPSAPATTARCRCTSGSTSRPPPGRVSTSTRRGPTSMPSSPASGRSSGSSPRIPQAMDDLYRAYILEHYRRPHNSGVLEDANASHEGANPLCGDRITLQLRLSGGQVAGVGFTGRGCAISQASASLLTDEIKGKSVDDVAKMTSHDILDLLGIEISPARLKCALLSLETMQHALGDAVPSSKTEAAG